MQSSKSMTLKQFIIFISATCALLATLVACNPERTIVDQEGKRGKVRDAIYSIEPRQNNAYVVWLRYDNEGVYCTDDAAIVKKIQNIQEEGTGWAILTYHTLIKQDPPHVCSNVENTPTHTIYIINDAVEVKSN